MDQRIEPLLRDALRSGRRLTFTASAGACSTCRMLDGRMFDPKIAPIIPVKGCSNQVCRCEYRPASD